MPTTDPLVPWRGRRDDLADHAAGMQLALFDTPAHAHVAQCSWCGALVAYGHDRAPARGHLGPCPVCGSAQGWWVQSLPVGVFHHADGSCREHGCERSHG